MVVAFGYKLMIYFSPINTRRLIRDFQFVLDFADVQAIWHFFGRDRALLFVLFFVEMTMTKTDKYF